MNSGIVYLIGAGPGDPGLITVRGMQLLRQADVIVYDRLAHPSLLDYAHPDAERIYVGKASAQHAMKQPDINNLLVDRARQGKTVARLKGGDPLVFGRGGEEAECCRAAGIRFEFVPGVTSAIAAPTYAGIPVTHRDAASSFAVITGHERDDAGEAGARSAGQAESRRNWKHIAWAADTLLFLMGVENLPEITSQLQEHGRPSETPVALVQWGTWPRQRVVTATLATIVEEAHRAHLTSPAVCVVGEVVNLRAKLRWFDDPESRPLFGKRVLVTRAREQASGLSSSLRALGADPIEFPTIKIVSRPLTAELNAALHSLYEYCWVVFTSVNAVTIFAEHLAALGLDSRQFRTCRIAAIGPATVEAVRDKLALRPDFVPTEAVSESVLDQWPETEIQGQRILIPCGSEARDVLPEGLRKRGGHVERIPIYDSILDDTGATLLEEQLRNGTLDLLTFTSSSTVTNFVKTVRAPNAAALKDLLGNIVIAAIGPITANTLREWGVEPQILAEEHTVPGLIAALEAYYHEEHSQ